ALDVLRDHGLDHLTIGKVAEAAGIAKGSVYNYFRNKQELVAQLFERSIEPVIEAGGQVVQGSMGAVEKLQAMLSLWFGYFFQHRGLFDFLFRDPHVRELCFTSQRSKNDLVIECFRTIFEQGMAEGSFRKFNALSAAEIAVGAAQFRIERQLDSGAQGPIENSIRELMDLILGGLWSGDVREGRSNED
ncbi:MAG: TetR/AcrR family transcriptional regulator, partial [Thermogutta sp.]|nr:TetR/AcrR family transcriptional regulator [Thermogutta sp.]